MGIAISSIHNILLQLGQISDLIKSAENLIALQFESAPPASAAAADSFYIILESAVALRTG